jgi:ribonuclease HII
MIVGIDEAGRGPLAGCVVSCALFVKEDPQLPVCDSKSISRIRREQFFSQFKEKTVFGLGLATNGEIDALNILEATFLSFERAIDSLLKKEPKLKKAAFIIDGNRFRTKRKLSYQCIEKADTKIREVAFASIVAKVFRDYLMFVAQAAFPEWKFDKHKGYPTKEHISLIEEYDLCGLHRKTFFPCRRRSGKPVSGRCRSA